MKNLLLLVFISIAFSFLVASKSYAAEKMSIPSTGYIGWIFKSNNGNHNGIDIWSNKEGGWNNNKEGVSNPVYPALDGEILYKFVDYPKAGYRIKHSDNLFTNYWHVKDLKRNEKDKVSVNDLLGYQDNDVTVHLHLTVANTNSNIGIDPSQYFNMQLNATLNSPVAWHTYVQKPDFQDQCAFPIVIRNNFTVNNGSTFICSVFESVTLRPEVLIQNGAEARFYLSKPAQ